MLLQRNFCFKNKFAISARGPRMKLIAVDMAQHLNRRAPVFPGAVSHRLSDRARGTSGWHGRRFFRLVVRGALKGNIS